MPQASENPHGIFCLETIWFDERSNPSTRSLLELLQRLQGVPFVYRDVNTRDEMDFCLGRWVDRSTGSRCSEKEKPAANYQLGELGILYLGFHGSPGKIYLPNGDEVDLVDIGESLTDENSTYDCSSSVVHFASCSVFRARKKLIEFKEDVRAACVSGYTKDVEPTTSWAFELMYLAELSELLNTENVNAGTLGKLKRRMNSKREYAGLSKSLGFTMIY